LKTHLLRDAKIRNKMLIWELSRRFLTSGIHLKEKIKENEYFWLKSSNFAI
jgi:hypothetical protein